MAMDGIDGLEREPLAPLAGGDVRIKHWARLSWHEPLLSSQGRQTLRIKLVSAMKESSFLSWNASQLGSRVFGHLSPTSWRASRLIRVHLSE